MGSDGGSMLRPKTFFLPAMLFLVPAVVSLTARGSLAESATEECKAKPDSSAPAGSHWYYRLNRPDKRHCWYLGPQGAKAHSAASEPASHVRSTPKAGRGSAAGTARATSANQTSGQALPEPAPAPIAVGTSNQSVGTSNETVRASSQSVRASSESSLTAEHSQAIDFVGRWPDRSRPPSAAREPAPMSSAPMSS